MIKSKNAKNISRKEFKPDDFVHYVATTPPGISSDSRSALFLSFISWVWISHWFTHPDSVWLSAWSTLPENNFFFFQGFSAEATKKEQIKIFPVQFVTTNPNLSGLILIGQRSSKNGKMTLVQASIRISFSFFSSSFIFERGKSRSDLIRIWLTNLSFWWSLTNSVCPAPLLSFLLHFKLV